MSVTDPACRITGPDHVCRRRDGQPLDGSNGVCFVQAYIDARHDPDCVDCLPDDTDRLDAPAEPSGPQPGDRLAVDGRLVPATVHSVVGTTVWLRAYAGRDAAHWWRAELTGPAVGRFDPFYGDRWWTVTGTLTVLGLRPWWWQPTVGERGAA